MSTASKNNIVEIIIQIIQNVDTTSADSILKFYICLVGKSLEFIIIT